MPAYLGSDGIWLDAGRVLEGGPMASRQTDRETRDDHERGGDPEDQHAPTRSSDGARSASGSESITLSESWGAGSPARTDSSWAATAAPNNRATPDSRHHTIRAMRPASGPYVWPNDGLNR